MAYKSSTKQREAQLRWKKERKVAIQDLKRKPCMDCGIEYHPVCMQFDHRESDKKFKNLSKMTNYSWDRIMEEISKCDLVCANCHALRTYNRLCRN
jgi:hypothetical protein